MITTQSATVLRHLRQLVTAKDAVTAPDRQLLDRFAEGREESAFAALVRRHGPLVLGVCRRVLCQEQDAEDVFQATFLVLARKAAAIDRRVSLGGWLYRVAFHMALKTRKQAAARQRREARSRRHEEADPLAEVTGRELLAVFDEELQRLPECERAALVACYLQGQTRDEAARAAGCSESTLKRRLERGKERMRQRLARRGVALPAALLAAVLAQGAKAVVPCALAASAVEAARLLARGQALAGVVSARAASLADEALRAMAAGKVKLLGALLLGVALLSVGTGLLASGPRGAVPPPADPAPAAKEPPRTAPADDARKMTVSGRVLDADGKAVAEAEVAVVAQGRDFAAKGYEVLKKGRADKDGRFRLTVPRLSFGEALLLAGKSGHAISQQQLNLAAARQEMTPTLPAEQPLHVKLLDLQGQPVAGVKVSVMRIGTRDDVSLFSPPEGVPSWPKPATSDADGRFTIAGLPRNQEVMLLVQDDRYASQHLTLSNNGDKERPWTLSPARLLEGKIVYEDSGKPAANARLSLAPAGLSTRTDAGGRFKMSLPDVRPSSLPPFLVYPAEGEPYLAVRQEITWPRAAVKHAVEVKVPRGVLVRGKVTEAKSGKPVAGAGVQFMPRESDNPNLRPDVLTAYQHVVGSGADGSFQIVVLPGPGHLLVIGPGLDFIHEEVGSNVLSAGKPGGARINVDGLVKLDLAPKADPKEVAVTLRRGVTVEGRLLDPDGKPVARAQMVCGLLRTALPSLPSVEVRDGVFALHGLDPEKDYPVMFLDAEHGWGAALTLSGKQASGDGVTVRLSPCGRAAVRLVDADSKPQKDRLLRDVLLHVVVTPGPTYEEAQRKGALAAEEEFAENLISRKERVATRNRRTDAEGRFTYAGLIPGATYRLSMLGRQGVMLKKEFRAESGKTLDLGDIGADPKK